MLSILKSERISILSKMRIASLFTKSREIRRLFPIGFTRKDLRQRGEMASLLAELCGLLRVKDILRLNATIDLRDVNASRTTLAALKCDFEIKAAENGILYIEVDL